MSEALQATKTYLSKDMVIVRETSDVVFAELHPDRRHKLGLEVEWEIKEAAALVVTEFTIGNGNARGRYRQLVEWKARKEGRAIVLMVPRDLNPASLTEFHQVLVVVQYPLVSFSQSWGTS